MRSAAVWLTNDRFSWLDVLIIGTTVGIVSAHSLPWFIWLPVCAAAGALADVLGRVLRRYATRRKADTQ